MDSVSINEALQRPLKSGNNYNKYFEAVNCKSTFLGKGNTTFGLQQMKSWANKYQYQTKEISKQLTKSTKHLTVSSIKSFVHDHLQYQIDGYNQQLRSPACSWSARRQGIDCKSYSLFASTILLNLGIKHSFRKVKQPGYNATQWSHVYVVIPDGDKQYVIDGTIKSNSELPFIEKEDLFMETKLPYYGLNAGVKQQSAPTKTIIRDEHFLNGFKQVLNLFDKIGIPKDIVEFVKNRTKQAYDKNGNFEFQFNLEPGNILNVDGKKIKLLPNGLNAGIDTSMFSSGGINTTLATTSTPIGVATGGGFDIMSLGTGLLSSFLGDFDIGANVGNVLKYGLSSWGATTTPENTAGKVNELSSYLQNILQGEPAQALTKFNKEYKQLLTYYKHIRANHANAKSTKLSYELMISKITELLAMEQQMVAQLKGQGYSVSANQSVANGVINIFTDTTPHNPNESHPDIPQTQYNVYSITGTPTKTVSNTQNYQTNTDGSPVLDNNGNTIPKPKTSTNAIIGYAGVAALAAFFVVPMLSKEDKKKIKNKNN